MKREEVTNRFNSLSREHRTTIIGNDLNNEITWLMREKKAAIDAHHKNLTRINERIKTLEKALENLIDD